jgi:hypothetical protein
MLFAGQRTIELEGGASMGMAESERLKLWVRAGGRCTLCKRYLLESGLTGIAVPLGEGAHIVGRVDSTKSPRGKDPLPVDVRDTAENVMLACSNCHTDIDKLPVAAVVDAGLLRARKLEHENEIRHQTGLGTDRRTAVLRVAGDIRGHRGDLPRVGAAEAVLRSGRRFPHFLPAYDQQGVEVDLRDIDGEEGATQEYYAAAKAQIDRALERHIRPAVVEGRLEHLSVFAIARLPLLMYLGAQLDDAIAIDIYQRHRTTQSWVWPDKDPGTNFAVTVARASDGLPAEAVLITNLSGTTPLNELPRDLADATVFQIDPLPGAAEDVIGHPDVLRRFDQSARDLFTGLEATHKEVKKLHVFGALPLSAALSLGRVLKSSGLRPTLVTYDRTDSGYVSALEI